MATSTEANGVHTFSWEKHLRRIGLLIARLGLAYLFFSQLFWKLPPRFGCGPGPGFEFTHVGPAGELARTHGLCDWIGLETVFAGRDRRFFNIWDAGGNRLFSIGLGPLVKANGWFVGQVVQPNMAWFGWLIFAAEAFVAASLFLGLFSRAGALVAGLLSFQLMLGLAGAWDPATHLNEWEWSYHLMILLSLVLFAVAPGRFVGLDAWLRPRLAAAADDGNRLARAALTLT